MSRLTVSGDARYRTIEESLVVALLLLHGWTFELRSDGRARAEQEAAAALEDLVAKGLPYARRSDGGRLFDPVEVSNFLRQAGLGGDDPTFPTRCVPSARRLVLEAQVAGPVRYAVTIRRRFNLAGRVPGEMVRLRLPVLLRDLGQTEGETEFLAPDGIPAEVRFASDRIDVTVPSPETGEVILGVRTTFDAHLDAPAGRVPMPDPDTELYLRASEGLIRVDDRVRSLAERLAGGQSDPWEVMRRLWRFMMDELACSAIHYDRIDPADPYRAVLEEGWYDCRLGSSLLAALCRARGIPARVVHGYMLYPVAPARHTWMEAWIDDAGWTPFDLFSWCLAVQSADGGWRDHFFGRIDDRMAVERPPLLFAGTGEVRLPPAWHMLTYANEQGTVIEFRDVETNAFVYAESITVERSGRNSSTARSQAD